MTSTAALLSSLKALLSAIETGDGEALEARLADVDRKSREAMTAAAPMLRHYLERRSYAKAIDFLEGRDQTSTPSC